jgi:hypothetical protein
MKAQAEHLEQRLRTALLQAYGVITPDEALVHTEHGGAEMFVSLQPGLALRVPAGADLRSAFDHLVGQALDADFPAHPRFGREVRPADLRRVHATVRAAIEDRDHRIRVEAAERKAMADIANPLKLGEQHPQDFALGHHWPNVLERKIAEAGLAGQPVKVGQARGWLDGPPAMGLPQEVADLVVLVFAEQTNRSVLVRGQPHDPAQLITLPPDAKLVEEPPPGKDAWVEARDRAQAVFGIAGVSELLTARNVRVLADRLRAGAREALPRCRDLVAALRRRGPTVVGDAQAAATVRVRVAAAAEGLCAALDAATGDVALIEALASADLGDHAAEHLGRSIASAQLLLAQMRRTDWNILAAVLGWGPDQPRHDEAQAMRARLAEGWRAGEFAIPLQPRLGEADQTARALLAAHERRFAELLADHTGSARPSRACSRSSGCWPTRSSRSLRPATGCCCWCSTA